MSDRYPDYLIPRWLGWEMKHNDDGTVTFTAHRFHTRRELREFLRANRAAA